MPRGRRPAPEAVQKAKGNTQRRPRRQPPADAAAPKAPRSAMPAYLRSAKAKFRATAAEVERLTETIWAQLQPELTRMNLLKQTDEFAFSRFCRYAAEWIAYTRIIDKEGAYYTTSSPHIAELRRPHPAFRQRQALEQHLKDLGDVLGLTPSARQRLLFQLATAAGIAPAAGSPATGGLPLGGERPDELPMTEGGASPIGFLGGPRPLLN